MHRYNSNVLFILFSVLFLMAMALCMAFGSTSASYSLHKRLHRQILLAPMSFFDTTPLGRLMNRFSKDIETVDSELPRYISTWVFSTAPILSIMIETIYTTPIFITVVIPLVIIFIIFQVSKF